MATAIPTTMIKSISGRIGSVVFYQNRGTQCVRTHVIPRNPDTQAQRIVRRAFGDAVRSWQSMNADEQYAFIRKARFLNMSGYNLYISGYMKTRIPAMLITGTSKAYPDNTLNSSSLNRIHSVSKTYKAGSGTNTHPGGPKHSPG